MTAEKNPVHPEIPTTFAYRKGKHLYAYTSHREPLGAWMLVNGGGGNKADGFRSMTMSDSLFDEFLPRALDQWTERERKRERPELAEGSRQLSASFEANRLRIIAESGRTVADKERGSLDGYRGEPGKVVLARGRAWLIHRSGKGYDDENDYQLAYTYVVEVEPTDQERAQLEAEAAQQRSLEEIRRGRRAAVAHLEAHGTRCHQGWPVAELLYLLDDGGFAVAEHQLWYVSNSNIIGPVGWRLDLTDPAAAALAEQITEWHDRGLLRWTDHVWA